MPLRTIRAPDNQTLWRLCADRFLDEARARPGPSDHPAWIWLGHSNLYDLLLERAEVHGVRGWLDPPITTFRDLPRLFGIEESPVGLLTRRRLLNRIAGSLGREILGREPGGRAGFVRAHMLDGVLSDLLPEGVTPDRLAAALEELGGDAFGRRRDRWIVEVYRAYLRELEAMGLRDWRSIQALISERIEAGGLAEALAGARRLHVYGLSNPRTRRRLLRALADQREVDVHLYLLTEPEPDEFEPLATEAETLDRADALPAPELRVQPVPDSAREMDWVAREVKALLADGRAEPHRVAVVARTGREDTRRAHEALTRAGVPSTARIRTPLSEIPALKALLLLFRGAANGWDYAALRAVLDHPYFDTGVDLRSIDFLAGRRRLRGLDEWEAALEKLVERVEAKDPSTRGAGLFADRVARDLEALRGVRAALEPLGEARSEAAWLDLTLELSRTDRGVFFLRRRLCDPVDERWDVVRLDQRGLVQLERLLGEWRRLDLDDESLEPSAWHALLRRLLEANELEISTPCQKGVQVLEAKDAALVPFDWTFVIHANDGEFPRAARTAGVLSDETRARLFERGVPLSHREEAMRRERALWRAVTCQAAPVRVSYRTTDARGTPLLPSLMVVGHEASEELPRTRRPRWEREPVNDVQADRLAAERLAAAMRAGAGAERATILAPARRDFVRSAIVAAVAEWHRGAGFERATDRESHPALRPNPWNGELRDPELLDWLEEAFGCTHRWSAGQLEQYGRAPFLFLVGRVLRLAELAEAEEETTPLAFGGVAHSVLERFYREVADSLPPSLDPAARDLLARTVDELCDELEASGEWLGLPSLWGVTREQVHRHVRDYVAWELAYLEQKGERPELVEEAFGFGEQEVHIEGEDLHGRRARIRVRGRIDRVDAARAGEAAHVLDYKSSQIPRAGGYSDGSLLQGPLYLRVLADRGIPVEWARYRAVKKPGSPQNGARVRFGSDTYEKALALALTIPGRVRSGLFEPVLPPSGEWKPWDPGLEIRRNGAGLESDTRFHLDRVEGVGSDA